MKIILAIFLIVNTMTSYAQNRYIGKWVVHDIREFKDRVLLPEEEKKVYESYFIFKADMTFEKYTQGKSSIGKYEFESNKLRFFEKDKFGEYRPTWSMRWPKKDTDPIRSTPEIDFSYPELFVINGTRYELDVYYVKSED